MLVSDSITRLRLTLRDLDETIFTDSSIVKVWNEIQMEFAVTGLLARAINLPVPAIAIATYTQLWESDFLAKPAALLYSFMSAYSYTQPWEPGVVVDTAPSVTGGYTASQMWEGFYAATQNRQLHYYPDDLLDPVFCAYDNEPIEWIFREQVEGGNTAFKTKSGDTPFVYVEDRASRVFFLYPKVVDTYGIIDIDTDYGEVVYDSDTSNASINPATDYGVIVFGSEAEVDSDYGVVIRAQTPDDAFYLIYKHLPIPVVSTTQTIEWPRWCVKYIEAGVLSRLFKAETDLFNVSLSNFFFDRFQFGLAACRTLKEKQYSMRTTRLASIQHGNNRRARKLADLPSHYPSYWGSR